MRLRLCRLVTRRDTMKNLEKGSCKAVRGDAGDVGGPVGDVRENAYVGWWEGGVEPVG